MPAVKDLSRVKLNNLYFKPFAKCTRLNFMLFSGEHLPENAVAGQGSFIFSAKKIQHLLITA